LAACFRANRTWDPSGIEPGPSELEFSALPTELSDISTNKFSITHYIGFFALGTTTANFKHYMGRQDQTRRNKRGRTYTGYAGINAMASKANGK
jgi:hypothetical protein